MYKHCFSLVYIYGFGSNNALYSARRLFIMFIFLLTLFNTRNCCSLNQISAWCCLLKFFLQKMQCCFVVNETWKTFPHEFIFVFILHFIGTIMTTCSSSSIYSWDKADFRVPGPKRSQPYLTMCIPIVTFGFPDTCEHSKNQLSSFIHSWDTAD